MSKQQKIRMHAASGLQNVIFIVLLFLIGGCGTKKIPQKPVYEGQGNVQIQPLARQVDNFYRLMLGQEESQRQYDKYIQEYSALESDISRLLQSGQRQPLNADASQLAGDILSLWSQRREEHERENTLSDGLIQLNRVDFEDMFQTLLRLENSEQN